MSKKYIFGIFALTVIVHQKEREMTSEQLKAIRKRLGMSQLEFARGVGVAVRTVTYWESLPPKKHLPKKTAHTIEGFAAQSSSNSSVSRQSS